MPEHVICSVDQRFIYIRGKIKAITFVLVKKAFARLIKHNSRRPINFFIESVGGDFYACLRLFNFLRQVNVSITTIAVRDVRSGAFFILQAGKKRFAVKGTTLEFHMSVKYILKDVWLNAVELTALAMSLGMIDAQQLLIFSEQGSPVAEIQRLFHRDARISAKRALELNLIDGIIPKSKIPKI